MAIDRSGLHRMCRGPVPRGVVIPAAVSLSPPRRRRHASPDPAAPQRNPPAPPRPLVHRRLTEQDYEGVVKHFYGLPHDVPEAFLRARGASSMMVELMELDHSIFSLLILEAQNVAAAEPPALHLYRQMQLAKATAAGLKKEKLKIRDPNGGMSRLAATITRMKNHKDPEDLQALKALLAEVNVSSLLYEPLVAKLREQEAAMVNIVANAVAHMRRNRGQVPNAASQGRQVAARAQPSALGALLPSGRAPQVQPQSSAATAQRVVPPDQRAAAVGGVLDNATSPTTVQPPQVQPQPPAASSNRVIPPSAAPVSSQARGPAQNRSSPNLQAPKRRRSVSPESASSSLAPTSSTSSTLQGSNGPPIATPSVPNQPSNNPELRKKQVARRTVVSTGHNSPPAQNPVNVAPDGTRSPPISSQPSHAPPLPKKAKVDLPARADPVSPTMPRGRTDSPNPASIPLNGTRSPPASSQPRNAPPLQKKLKLTCQREWRRFHR